MAGLVLPVFTLVPPPVGRHQTLQLESARLMRPTAMVTGRSGTERRTLQPSMWYGFSAQSAFLVRGSTRRIMPFVLSPGLSL